MAKCTVGHLVLLVNMYSYWPHLYRSWYHNGNTWYHCSIHGTVPYHTKLTRKYQGLERTPFSIFDFFLGLFLVV